MSEDPIGFAGGDANLGRYVGNFATGGRDVNGLDVVWAVQISPGNPATQIGGINPSSRLRPTSSPPLRVVEKIEGDDTIGLGVLVPPGVEGRKGTVANPPSRESGSTSWLGGYLDLVQGSLDAGGTVEPTPFCDIANAGICVARGQWVDAGLTILGVIPYFGDAGKAVKHARKLAEGTAEIADTVNDLNKAADLAGDLKNLPAPVNGGRSGKQARLRELADDPNVSSADRGWIRQEINQIERGKRKTIRVPGSPRKQVINGQEYGGNSGKVLAHRRGYEARKGFGYEHSDLQDKVLHKLQHKHEGYK